MIATLIPFFLVSHVTVENPWERGAEFVFRVDVDSSMIFQEIDDIPMNASINADLFCRPNEPDKLTCRLRNGQITGRNIPHDGKVSDVSGSIEDLIDEPFEVKFNDLGMEYLVLPEDMQRFQINMIRSFVNKLTIGVDLSDKPDGTYDLPKSSVEPCNVRLHVTRYPRSIPQERWMLNKTYRLESLPRLNKPPTENIEIIKQRNVGRCSDRETFVFDNILLIGDTEKYQPGIKFLEEHITYSTNMITVTNIDYRSSTRNKGTVKFVNRPGTVDVTEIIGIRLLNVREAQDEWPPVLRPVETSIIHNSEMMYR